MAIDPQADRAVGQRTVRVASERTVADRELADIERGVLILAVTVEADIVTLWVDRIATEHVDPLARTFELLALGDVGRHAPDLQAADDAPAVEVLVVEREVVVLGERLEVATTVVDPAGLATVRPRDRRERRGPARRAVGRLRREGEPGRIDL